MLADDPGDLLFGIVFGCLFVRLARLAERQADGRAHLAVLRAVGFVNQEGHPQPFNSGLF
jgi:hypothetical protein